MSVRKKKNELSHAMVKLFHHVLFSRVLEQVNDQEMRDGKSNHSSNHGLKVDLYISFFGR